MEDQVRVSIRSVEGCGSRLKVKKFRKPATIYKIAPSGNSEIAGRKIVGVASEVLATKTLSRRFVLSQSTLNLVN